MTINIQYVKIPFSEAMTEFILTRLNCLGEKYPGIKKSQVSFKLENDADKIKKVCKIELEVPGPNIFASKELNSDLALKEAILEIEKQLEVQNRDLIAC